MGLHFPGPSSRGKSTAQAYAGSWFTNPLEDQGIVKTVKGTTNAIEYVYEMGVGTSLHFDEAATTDPKTVVALPFNFVSASGKKRLTASIEPRRVPSWDGGYLTLSSEKTLPALAIDAGVAWLSGAAVRMPSVNAEGAPIIDAGEAKRIKDVVFTHYGHAGPLFVAEMFRRGYHKEPGELQRMVKDKTDALLKDAHDTAGKSMSGTIYRVAENFAVLHAVGRIAVEGKIIAGSVADIDRIVEWAWHNFLVSPDANALDTAGDGADRLLLLWLKSNPGKVRAVNDTTGYQQVVAWYRDDIVYLPVGNMAQVNLPTGEETVINELDRRGLLIKQGRNRKHERIPGPGKLKHYRIKLTVVESTDDARAGVIEEGVDPAAANFMFRREVE